MVLWIVYLVLWISGWFIWTLSFISFLFTLDLSFAFVSLLAFFWFSFHWSSCGRFHSFRFLDGFHGLFKHSFLSGSLGLHFLSFGLHTHLTDLTFSSHVRSHVTHVRPPGLSVLRLLTFTWILRSWVTRIFSPRSLDAAFAALTRLFRSRLHTLRVAVCALDAFCLRSRHVLLTWSPGSHGSLVRSFLHRSLRFRSSFRVLVYTRTFDRRLSHAPHSRVLCIMDLLVHRIRFAFSHAPAHTRLVIGWTGSRSSCSDRFTLALSLRMDLCAHALYVTWMDRSHTRTFFSGSARSAHSCSLHVFTVCLRLRAVWIWFINGSLSVCTLFGSSLCARTRSLRLWSRIFFVYLVFARIFLRLHSSRRLAHCAHRILVYRLRSCVAVYLSAGCGITHWITFTRITDHVCLPDFAHFTHRFADRFVLPGLRFHAVLRLHFRFHGSLLPLAHGSHVWLPHTRCVCCVPRIIHWICARTWFAHLSGSRSFAALCPLWISFTLFALTGFAFTFARSRLVRTHWFRLYSRGCGSWILDHVLVLTFSFWLDLGQLRSFSACTVIFFSFAHMDKTLSFRSLARTHFALPVAPRVRLRMYALLWFCHLSPRFLACLFAGSLA